jgi:hypothetical protein
LFEIGTSLRQARQHRGLDVSDVERETRIRAKYLTALEEERFEVLPGAAYVRGFLRTYAEFLGLDGNLLVAEFNEQFAPPEDDLPAIQPTGIGRPPGRLAQPVLGVVAATVVFGGIAVWQLGFTSAERTPIPQAHAAAPVVRPHAKPRRQAVSPARHAVAKAPQTFVVRAARGDCWLLVRSGSASGPVVYEGTLATGGTVRFGLQRGLWVRLGAPWNVDATLRGKAMPPFPRRIVNLRAV